MKSPTIKLLIAFMLVFSSPVIADQHALLIGISDYEHERIEDLEGPVYDVSALRTVLNKNWGVSEANITSLVNKDATERNIKSAFHALLDNSRPGDDIVIYFSGHGTSIKDKDFGALLNLPHTSGALVAYDFNPAKHIARMQSGKAAGADDDGLLVGRYEIKPILELLNKDRTVFVIFDSCFSGNAVRSMQSKYTPKQKRLLNISHGDESEFEIIRGSTGASRCLNCESTTKDKPFEYNNVIYFGAAADNQLAIEHSQADINAGLVDTIDGKPHGGFSDALLRVLSSTNTVDNKRISYRKLFNLAVSTFNVNCANCGHNPVLLSSANSNAASKSVLSKQSSDVDASNILTYASFDTNAQNAQLQIAAANLSTPATKAISLVDSVELNQIRPDIELLKTDQHIKAFSADGQLLSTLPTTDETSRLTHWLSVQAWLKARKLKDAAQNSGNIRANFRHPLTNPVAFKGESVYFTVSLNEDAKLVALVTNSQGYSSLLYPFTLEEANQVFKGERTFKFPSLNNFKFTAVEPWGTDTVTIYALPTDSNLSLALLRLAKKPDFKHTEPAFERFTNALDSGDTLYSSAHVRFHTTQ